MIEQYFDESVLPIYESGWDGNSTGWTHYAVVSSDKTFCGVVSEDDLLHFSKDDLKGTNKYCIDLSIHPLDCVKKFQEFDTNVLFCIVEGKYRGAITEGSILDYFNDYSSITENSSILILEVLERNFSLAELAKIVESEGIKLTQMQSRYVDTENLELTLVLQTKDLKTIIGVLENKGYKLVQKYNELGVEGHLKERYDNLMTYLNI